jgi:hypothetical protein
VSLPFSRSIRSLNIDSYRASRIGMILAIVIMILLFAWFFFAKVTLYEVSSDLTFTEDGHVLAYFPKEAHKRIQTGQPVIMRVYTDPDQAGLTIPGLVISTDEGSEQVMIVMISDEVFSLPLQEGLTGQAQVEVEYVTPATLVRRASGSYLNNSQFPVSPQDVEQP